MNKTALESLIIRNYSLIAQYSHSASNGGGVLIIFKESLKGTEFSLQKGGRTLQGTVGMLYC